MVASTPPPVLVVDSAAIGQWAIILETERMNDQIVKLVTNAVRNADRHYPTSGGSTRHYVRDYLIAAMTENGLHISLEEQITTADEHITELEQLAADFTVKQKQLELMQKELADLEMGVRNQENLIASQQELVRDAAKAMDDLRNEMLTIVDMPALIVDGRK